MEGSLSNLQLEILKLYAYNVSDEQLKEIKQVLAEYFAQKATTGMEQLWEDSAWNQNKIEEWKNLHQRTPYKANE